MPSPIGMPLKLKLVAGWFIWEGISAVIDIALAFDEKLLIDFSVCQFFVGVGLLRLNPRSHDWAMFWVKWGIAGGVIWSVLIFFFAEPGAQEYKIFEKTVGYITPNSVIVYYILRISFIYWQYAVLNSREIRLLFNRVETM